MFSFSSGHVVIVQFDGQTFYEKSEACFQVGTSPEFVAVGSSSNILVASSVDKTLLRIRRSARGKFVFNPKADTLSLKPLRANVYLMLRLSAHSYLIDCPMVSLDLVEAGSLEFWTG